MVELALPKNSKVGEGKTWTPPRGARNLREYRVYRWNPDDGQNPRLDTYFVDTDDCAPMVSMAAAKSGFPALSLAEQCLPR